MKIIEAMKKIKANDEKIADLQLKISVNCAHLSYETPAYKDKQAEQVKSWLQTCTDLTQENARLSLAISRTNLATPVSITLNDVVVTKCIAEWVLRRRKYAKVDENTWSKLTTRGLKEGMTQSTTGGEPMKVTVIRNYDQATADNRIAIYKSEPHEIDGALEVANAITDLIEHSY